MSQTLRRDLQVLFAAYTSLSPMSEATIAARAAGDWRFFDRLSDPSKTFTVKKYEEIIDWFAESWPDAAG